MEWFRSQLSLARALLDDAIAAIDDSAARADIASARDICDAVTADLYKATLAPGERGEIERELAALRSGVHSLSARRGLK